MPIKPRFWICSLVMLLGACEPGAFLFLQIFQIPESARTVSIHPSLNGTAAREQLVRPFSVGTKTITAGLRLSSRREGELTTDIGLFDEHDCLVARGKNTTQLGLNDEYRELPVVAEPLPTTGLVCRIDGTALLSVTPSRLRTTGRDEERKPVPLHLYGWGFQAGMQVTIGSHRQTAPHIISYQEAVIDQPDVAGEVGATRVLLEQVDGETAVLENALTVTMAPIVWDLKAPLTRVPSSSLLDVAAGDFDGDGRPSLAVLDSKADVWFYEYQDARGPVAQSTRYTILDVISASPRACSMIAGDLNKDGTDDLLIVSPTGSALLQGPPGGVLSVTKLPGIVGRDADLADMDGDSRVDIVTGGDKIAVYRNAENGVFSLVPSMQMATAADSVRAVDMNKDGRPDIVALTSSGELLVLLSDGNTLSGRFQYPARTGCPSLAPALAVTNSNRDGTQMVLLNGVAALFLDPLGSFGLQYVDGISPCFDSLAVTATDLNSDGESDLVWLQNNYIFLVPQIGQGRASTKFGSTIATLPLESTMAPVGPRHLPLADFNRDGTKDLVLGHNVLLIAPQ